MKDNRDKQMAQLAGWTWDLNGYAGKVPFYNADDLTMREVQSVFQLDPEPPVYENLNDILLRPCRAENCAGFPFSCTTMKTGSMVVFAVSCCGRGWIAMTQNAFWTTK